MDLTYTNKAELFQCSVHTSGGGLIQVPQRTMSKCTTSSNPALGYTEISSHGKMEAPWLPTYTAKTAGTECVSGTTSTRVMVMIHNIQCEFQCGYKTWAATVYLETRHYATVSAQTNTCHSFKHSQTASMHAESQKIRFLRVSSVDMKVYKVQRWGKEPHICVRDRFVGRA
jgi:hypothetical protein